MIGESSCHGRGTRSPHLGRACSIRGNRGSERLAHAGVRPPKIVIDLAQRSLLAQPIVALTRHSAAPPSRCHPLTEAQMEPFNEGGVDVPAAGGQELIDRPCCAADHAMVHLDKPPAPRGVDHRRGEESRPRPPARLGPGAWGLAPRWRHPGPAMRHNGGEIIGGPVAQKERHTPGRPQLRELLQHDVSHRPGAFPALDVQQPFARGIDRGPDPVR